MAKKYILEPIEEERRFANRRAASFGVYCSRQTAREGDELAVELDANFDRGEDLTPGCTIKKVDVELDPPTYVEQRRGMRDGDDPSTSARIKLKARGDRREPYWVLEATDTTNGLTDCEIAVYDPPLCTIVGPQDGQIVRARMVTQLKATSVDIGKKFPATERGLHSTFKKKVLARMALKEIGDPDETGFLLLGEVAARVVEIEDPE